MIVRRAWAAAAITLSSILVWHFHNLSWYPIDDGNYAHVAERLAAGEVLNRDVQDIHAGYINFLNAAALRLFGNDLLSLRYPLVLAAIIQAALIYRLISRRDRAVALVAAIGSIALGVIQFFNPTAHWYCGTLTVGLAVWLMHGPQHPTRRLVGAGVFIGVIALFRQPTGVWVGMGVLAVALAERADGARGWQTVCSRGVIGAMLLGVIAYAASTREPLGALLIASPPAAILIWMFAEVRTGSRATGVVIIQLGVGAAAAAVPLVAYHIANQSLSPWLDDVLVRAAKLTTLDFFGRNRWYAAAVIAGTYQALSNIDPVKWLNGAYWAVIPLLPLLNGAGILHRLRRREGIEHLTFPIITAFYALVSLHLQIPIYLYYSAGICLAAVLWQKAAGSRYSKLAWMASASGLAAVGIVYHAAQPYTRTARQILEGWRRSTPLVAGFERCTLRLDREDRDVYGRLVSLIQQDAPPGDSIFAVPSDAELYFLTNRRNPFRYYNTALGVQTADDLAETLHVLAIRPPAVVTFRPKDKYNTPASRRIMEQVRAEYERTATVGEIEVYRLRRSGP